MPVTADSYFPFDGQEVAEAEWRAMARHWRPSGPLITDLAPADWDVLQPSAGAGLQVLVEAGSAWIRGHYAEWESQEALTIGANSSGSTRVDAIVARLDATDNLVELDVVAGTPGAGLPALTQDSSTWEILLGSSTLLNGGSSVTVADLRKCVGYSETTYTPTVSFGATSATLANTTTSVVRRDGLVHVRAHFQLSNLNAGTGSFSMTLPSDLRALFSTSTPSNLGGAVAFNGGLSTYKPAFVLGFESTPDRVHLGDPTVTGAASGSLLWNESDLPATWNVRLDFDYEAAN
jgi:hypothetical protein